jgi:hypothetical protein
MGFLLSTIVFFLLLFIFGSLATTFTAIQHVLVQRQMDTGPQKRENFTIEEPPLFLANIAGVVGEPKPVSVSVL